jgi:hypothetical protein
MYTVKIVYAHNGQEATLEGVKYHSLKEGCLMLHFEDGVIIGTPLHSIRTFFIFKLDR